MTSHSLCSASLLLLFSRAIFFVGAETVHTMTPTAQPNIGGVPLCEADLELNQGETHRCVLRDTVHITFSDGQYSPKTLIKFQNGKIQTDMSTVKDIGLFLQNIVGVAKRMWFKSRIDVVCDSLDELDYYYQNKQICAGRKLNHTWQGRWKNLYYNILDASLARLGQRSLNANKNFLCSLDVPQVELQRESPLTVRRKIPRKDGVVITARHSSHFDRETFMLLVYLVILSYLGPRILQNSVSRVVICVSLGSLLCVLLVAIFVVRDIGKTNIGRVGVASAVFFGSLTIVSDSLFRGLLPWIALSFKSDRNLQIGGVVTSLAVIAAFRYFNLDRYICLLAHALLRLSQFALLAFAISSNKMLCLSCMVLPIFAYCTVIAWWFLNRNKNGVAFDSFPPQVYREAPVSKPKACDTLSGTREEKMRKYELEGTIQTRKCLEKLGENIRTNVKVVTRTNDPNTIAHWAGVS